jgi:hypothetical protein
MYSFSEGHLVVGTIGSGEDKIESWDIGTAF